MFASRYVARGAAFLALAAAVGCSGGNDLGQFATVSGTVTHNGAPVDGAKVEFHGTTEAEGKKDAFSSTTDSTGKYMIAGVGKNPGIPPGMYKVVVTKYQGKGPMPEGYDPGQIEAQMSDGGGGRPAVINLLPKEYSTAGSTKLSATVEQGKNENVNFDLKGKAK